MKILVISDFDSGFKTSLILKLKKEKPDLIISQGDFCYGDKMRDILFANWDEIKDEDKKWYDFISKTKAQKLVKESLTQGKKVIKELASLGVPVFVVYGNHEHWDYKEEDSAYYRKRFDNIIAPYSNVHSLESTNHEFGGLNFVGYGDFNSGPEYKRLNPKEFIKRRKFLKRYVPRFSNSLPNILITHNVPFNTKLDLINNPKSPRHGEHFGSKYTRKLITKFNPMLCISGHMHENQGKVSLKDTVCVNSGMGSKGQYATVDISKTVKIKLFK